MLSHMRARAHTRAQWQVCGGQFEGTVLLLLPCLSRKGNSHSQAWHYLLSKLSGPSAALLEQPVFKEN